MSILIVAPFLDLARTAHICAATIPYPIHIIQGDLEAGLAAAEAEIRRDDVELVISRGGTAQLLEKHLSVPVFEIAVTSFDLLRAIYPHVRRKKKIAVIGYENVIRWAKSIAQILSIDLGYYLLDDQNNTGEVIAQARQWGAQVIAGDAVAVHTARLLGMESELINSGPEAITDSLQSAIDFLGRMQTEIIRGKRLSMIMEHASQGIIYLDGERRIELINSRALEIFQRPLEQLIGKVVDETIFPAEFVIAVNERRRHQLISVANKNYMVEVSDIASDKTTVATLVFLQSSGRIKDMEDELVRQLTQRGLIAKHSFSDMIDQNPRILRIIEMARRYSATNSTILLMGETGVGKEMFAQSIHNASKRKEGPFVPVNCAVLPENLLESELFGYAEGAFTGAKKGGKAGLFEIAHRGTIFLDEINDMSASVQARLLRVLQEKQVMRIGDDRVHTIDVRFIAACNRDLEEEVACGRFRKDLYYRLRVLDITIPPLRERREDILPLFNSFIDAFAVKHGFSRRQIPDTLVKAIERAPWPGNIRQLRNYAEKIGVLLSMSIDITDMKEELIAELVDDSELYTAEEPSPYSVELKDIKGSVITECWQQNDHNISKTARILNIDRATVRKYVRNAPQE